MKLLRNVKYDINEGFFKYWYKWILVFVLQLVNCCVAYNGTTFIREIYGNVPLSALEVGAWSGIGRFPYIFNPDVADKFSLPFEWIVQYSVLAYLIGGYIKEDMQGYGVHLMIKSRKRSLWWLSKSIWCVFINVMYFVAIWITNIAFSWIVSGKEMFVIHKFTMENINRYFNGISGKQVFLVMILLPLLVGILHSMIQMVTSMFFGEEAALCLIGVLLVVTSYYSHPLLFSGYSMSKRFIENPLDATFEVLNYKFGLIYMVSAIVVIYILGLVYTKKKNIYW